MKATPSAVPAGKLGVSLFGADLDGVLADLDQAFDKIRITPRKPELKKTGRKKKLTVSGVEQMQATYVEVANMHLRPVLRYLKAIEMGVASKDLCEIVHFVIGPVIGKTRKVGLVEHTKSLISFQRGLKEVVASKSKTLTETQRETLSKLFVNVRNTFGLTYRGHATAVVNLLGFYKALRKNSEVTDADVKKIFAIGIPSLTMLRKSSVAEIVSLSGISTEKAWKLRREARKFNILSVL